MIYRLTNAVLRTTNYGFVYLIGMDLSFLRENKTAALPPSLRDRLGAVKIGATKPESSASVPEKRLKAFQTGTPFELELIAEIPCTDPFALEKYFHKQYEPKNVRNECFLLSQTDIIRICREGMLFYRTGTVSDEPMFRTIVTRKDQNWKEKHMGTHDMKLHSVLAKKTSRAIKVRNEQEEEVRQILVKYRWMLLEDRNAFNCKFLTPKDFKTVLEALENHPDARSKIGVGVEGIFVKQTDRTDYGSFCFHVKRPDGSEEEFCYRACFPEYPSRLGDTHKAVRDYSQKFRETEGNYEVTKTMPFKIVYSKIVHVEYSFCHQYGFSARFYEKGRYGIGFQEAFSHLDCFGMLDLGEESKND